MVAAGDAEMTKPAPDLILFLVVLCSPPTVSMIFFTFFSFPSKDDLPRSCLSFILIKLIEEETYAKTSFNEDYDVSLLHTRS